MKLYNATATLGVVFAAITDDQVDEIHEALEGYDPALAGCPVGRTEIIITYPAESLRQATSTALALLSPFDPVGLEVTPTALWHQRIDAIAIPQLVSVTQAAEDLGVTRQAVLGRLESGSLAGQRVGNVWVLPAAGLTPPSRGPHSTPH